MESPQGRGLARGSECHSVWTTFPITASWVATSIIYVSTIPFLKYVHLLNLNFTLVHLL